MISLHLGPSLARFCRRADEIPLSHSASARVQDRGADTFARMTLRLVRCSKHLSYTVSRTAFALHESWNLKVYGRLIEVLSPSNLETGRICCCSLLKVFYPTMMLLTYSCFGPSVG
jgi:hypothetical protein